VKSYESEVRANTIQESSELGFWLIPSSTLIRTIFYYILFFLNDGLIGTFLKSKKNIGWAPIIGI